MTQNEQLIHAFYSAFQQRNYRAMQTCYADYASFSDPVFRDLTADQVRSMWKMFCVKNQTLTVEYGNVQVKDTTVTADWTANYVLSSTGNRVKNDIKSRFVIQDGKITEHTDTFDFYRWARQALGAKGILLGWTPFVKRKVQRSAMATLQDFIRHQTKK